MPRAIVDLDEFVESNNIMVYGDTGAGKTELVAQLPGKVLIVSSENGTIVIRKALARLGLSKAAIAKEMKRFKVWRIRSWQDLEDCYTWCRDNQGVFDWIAIDSATSLDQRAMRAAMEVAVKRNPEKRDIDLPDRGEHQKRQNAMKRMIGDFNELSTDILWLAQAMRREDQDGNEIVVPFITGKDYEVSAFACAQMQAFGYYMKKRSKTKGQTDRVIIWESYADKDSGINYWSKDRYDVFPKVCVMVQAGEQQMSMADLIAMITPEALSGAVAKVAQADDEAEPEWEDEDTPDEEEDEEPEPDDEEPEDEPEDDAEDDEEDDEPTEYQARRDELLAMKPMQLKEAVEAVELSVADFKGKPMAVIVDAVLAEEFGGGPDDSNEEEEDEDDLNLDEMMADEEEDEPEPEPPAKTVQRRTPAKAAPAKPVTKKPATVTPIRKPAKRIRAN
jgi:hypothetical protein